MPHTPEIKTMKPITFLFHRAETTVAELINFIPVGQQLFKEAVEKKLFITGPIHWHYIGFDGDEKKPFTLEISLPVGEVLSDYDGNFHFKRTDDFKSVCLTHEGRWDEIPKSYGTIMQFMEANHLTPAGITREVYVNADFNNQEANVTQIQIGIH